LRARDTSFVERRPSVRCAFRALHDLVAVVVQTEHFHLVGYKYGGHAIRFGDRRRVFSERQAAPVVDRRVETGGACLHWIDVLIVVHHRGERL
jgi:hypothetical protein